MLALPVEMTNTEHQALLFTLAVCSVSPGSQKSSVDFFSHSFLSPKFLITDHFKRKKILKRGLHQISQGRELDGETKRSLPGLQKKGGKEREGWRKVAFIKPSAHQTLVYCWGEFSIQLPAPKIQELSPRKGIELKMLWSIK